MNISEFFQGFIFLLSLALSIYIAIKGKKRRIAEQVENDAVAKTIDMETEIGRDASRDETSIPFALYLRPFGLERYVRKQRKWVPFDANKPLFTEEEIDFDYFLQEHYHGFGMHLISLDSGGTTQGAGHIVTDDEHWFNKFCGLAGDAKVIVIIPGTSLGALEEIRWLTGSEFLDKTIFLKPQGFPRSEWKRTSDYFRENEGLDFPPYSPLLMSFRINKYGRYHHNETWKEISGYYDLNWYREQMKKILLNERLDEWNKTKRILIIGSGGAGKSTLARRLGEKTGIEVVHLDKLYWNPGWVKTGKEEWSAIVRHAIEKESWIMDGNFGGTLEMRARKADTIIFMDMPRLVCIYRILKRWFTYRNTHRPDMAPGCDEKVDWEFLMWVWDYPRRSKPEKMLVLNRFAGEKRIIRLRSNREVEDFLSDKMPNSVEWR